MLNLFTPNASSSRFANLPLLQCAELVSRRLLGSCTQETGCLLSKRGTALSFPSHSDSPVSLCVRLSMRAGFMIFSRLREFLDYTDSKAAAQGQGPEDETIDPHFRSGVLLGSG